MGQLGGRRPGAGRKPGSKSKATLEKERVLAAFNQRILTQADALFNAQFRLAIGSAKVFRIDEEEGDNGKTKRVHSLVTDADEIKALLDEHDGSNGIVGESYYYFSEVLPDNRALDSLLNRGLGKPTEHVEMNVKPEQSSIEDAKRIYARKYRELNPDLPDHAVQRAAEEAFMLVTVEDKTGSEAS